MADPSAARARPPGATLSLGVALFTAAFAALLPPACLDTREQPKTDPDVARCTGCHGDPSRPGDYLAAAAPPFDLSRQSVTGSPGVGAHSIHLNPGATHAAIACDECHVVPERVDSPGHADDASPADVTFGVLARQGERSPEYDPARRTCVDSYCHQEARPVWSEPLDSDGACGSCHGLPPPSPHPQSDRCFACHGEIVDADRHFLAPERHVDGVIDYAAGDCQLCHGSADNPAPPLDTSGNQDLSAIGVGAHQTHLTGGSNSRPLECGECHRVPEAVEEPTHADGLPAEVLLTGVALSMDRTASWDSSQATCSGSFCHSPSPGTIHDSPVWNAEVSLDCTSCHEAPPAPPHPQMTDCSVCHAPVAGSGLGIDDKSRHVDGNVDVEFDDSCNACHGGDDNAAPPRDIEGNVDTMFAGVGAHQTHVLGTELSRAVPCGECHVVPEDVFDAGHMDSDRPAELRFSDVALAQGAAPVYENGTCRTTSCHGAIFPDGHESGGTNTEPRWTRVDGTEAACGSCHAIPPPRPHPNPDSYPCAHCHANMAADNLSFTRPDLHVDGIVTFQLDD
jgi:predicted CxxxxCH...CXXCH cytochrome family protein